MRDATTREACHWIPRMAGLQPQQHRESQQHSSELQPNHHQKRSPHRATAVPRGQDLPAVSQSVNVRGVGGWMSVEAEVAVAEVICVVPSGVRPRRSVRRPRGAPVNWERAGLRSAAARRTDEEHDDVGLLERRASVDDRDERACREGRRAQHAGRVRSALRRSRAESAGHSGYRVEQCKGQGCSHANCQNPRASAPPYQFPSLVVPEHAHRRRLREHGLDLLQRLREKFHRRQGHRASASGIRYQVSGIRYQVADQKKKTGAIRSSGSAPQF